MVSTDVKRLVSKNKKDLSYAYVFYIRVNCVLNKLACITNVCVSGSCIICFTEVVFAVEQNTFKILYLCFIKVIKM